MNQGKLEQALTLLTQADALYAAEVPDERAEGKAAAGCVSHLSSTAPRSPARSRRIEGLLTDPRAQSALLGLIEVRRNRAVVLRVLGQPAEADALLAVGERSGARQRPGAADRQRPAVPHHRADLGGAGAGHRRRWTDLQRIDRRRSAGRCRDRSRSRRPTCCTRASCCAPAAAPTRCRCATARSTALAALKAGTTPDLMAPVPRRLCRGGGQQKDQRAAAAGGDVHRGATGAGRHHQPADRPGQRDAGGECARSEGRRGDPPAARR